MSDPIELTQAETDAAAEAGVRAFGWGYRKYAVVDLIVEAINKVRAGDQIGTIRLHPDGSRLIVRVNVNEPEYSTSYVQRWVHINLRCGVMSRPDADYATPDWPVIYTPRVVA